LSISILETDIVCNFNSRVTSYNEQSASLKVFSFRKMETLFTKAMRYLHLCFMVLAFPRVASFNAGTLLYLADRCEPSLHGSSSWENITMLSFRARRLSDFDYVICLRIVSIQFYQVMFLGNVFVFALAIILLVS